VRLGADQRDAALEALRTKSGAGTNPGKRRPDDDDVLHEGARVARQPPRRPGDPFRPTDAELAVRPETGTGQLRLDLSRRLVAEGLGTAFLIIAVIGSGIMASRLSPSDVGLQLLENAAATAGALIGLILMFGAVSGAHFNPIVTLVDRLLGTISTRDAGLYVVAQTIGGCVGAVIANLMFSLPAVEWSTHARSSGALWLSEVVATIGLLLVIHGCVRTGRSEAVPFAVGVWIGGAYWFTSSTSFANPAVTFARMLSDTFAGIKPSSAPMFIVMQFIGALLAYQLIRFIYPHNASETNDG
jgi:arsenate reductase